MIIVSPVSNQLFVAMTVLAMRRCGVGVFSG